MLKIDSFSEQRALLADDIDSNAVVLAVSHPSFPSSAVGSTFATILWG
jgi:hypothetical protein